MWHTILLIHRLKGRKLWWVCGDAFDGELADTETSLDLWHQLRWTQVGMNAETAPVCVSGYLYISVMYGITRLCPQVVSTGPNHLVSIGHSASFISSSAWASSAFMLSVWRKFSNPSQTFPLLSHIYRDPQLADDNNSEAADPALDSHNSQSGKRNSLALSALSPSRLASSLPSPLRSLGIAKLPGALEWSSRIMTYTNAVLRLMVASV